MDDRAAMSYARGTLAMFLKEFERSFGSSGCAL